jgi:pentatricopeptide repeat protein
MVLIPEHTSSDCCLFMYPAAGNKDEGKFLYEQLTALGAKADDSALATLIVQYGQDQQLEQAQELFEATTTTASSSVGDHAYNAMVDALCKCGKTDKAYDLFTEMADQGKNRDAVTISILVTHLTKHGKSFSACFPKPQPANVSDTISIHVTSMAVVSPRKISRS